jgi:hypothetical protein
MAKRDRMSRERRRNERLNRVEDCLFWACIAGVLGLVWMFVGLMT